MHERFPSKIAGVVDEKLCREIIHPVDHHRIVANQFQRVPGHEPVLVQHHCDVRVQRLDLFLGGEYFGPSHIGCVMDDLSLEVRQVHDVAVDESQGANAGRSQVQSRRRTEAAGTDDQNARLSDFFAPCPPLREARCVGCTG